MEILINDHEYEIDILHVYEFQNKNNPHPAIKAIMEIRKDGMEFKNEDFVDSYVAETISEFVKNKLQGKL